MLSRRAAAALRRTATAARRRGISVGIARAVAVATAPHRGLASAGAAASAPVKLKHSVYDVIVVGGGMVGSAFACALAANPDTRHLRVALLEAAPLHKHVTQPLSSTSLNPAPSIRVSSVTPLSALFLDEIGAWADMRAQRVTPFTDMQVWHSAGRGRVHWTAAEAGTDVLGYIVENDIIQNSLLRRLVAGPPAAASSSAAEAAAAASTAAAADDDAGGVEVLAPAKVEALHPAASAANATNDWLRVTVGGSTVSTRLLVGADGAQSVVKRFAGLSSVGWSYGQLAVVATVQHAPLPTGAPVTAWQRFLPDGPVAFLPCHSGYSNIVWSTTPAHAKHLSSIPVAQFVADLNSAFRAPPSAFQPAGVPSAFESLLPPSLQQMLPILFPAGSSAAEGARVDNIRGQPLASAADSVAPGVAAGTDPALVPPAVTGVVGPRLHFPLGVAHGTAYVRPRVALIGDSAHTIHPMAGQGVNLGFGDAQALARTVARALHTGTDVGAVTLLREYERDRMAHNTLMTAAVHGIKQLFEVSSGPFPALRGAGLDAFNSIPAIKTHASRVAMGLKAPTQA